MTTPSAQSASALGQAAGLPRNATLRTSRIGICATLYALTLRQHLHGKRWVALALLFLIPAGLASLIRLTSPDVPSLFLEFLLSWILIPQALVPLVALLYASGIVQDEQEEQTITYLLIRPIPKWLIYAVKMFATWTTTVLLVIGLTLLTFAAIYVRSSIELAVVSYRCLCACAILSLAVVAYCSLFGLMSLLTKRILVVGVLYTAIVEGFLATFPLSLRMVTIVYYTRLIAYRTLDFDVTWPRGRQDDVAATTWLLDISADPTLSEHPQRSTCVLVLLLASVVCTVLAGWLCSQREFHVKTPEKE
jgi:ABC-2 type transport system permease protein